MMVFMAKSDDDFVDEREILKTSKKKKKKEKTIKKKKQLKLTLEEMKMAQYATLRRTRK